MIATERDAKKTWWCPFAQVRYFGGDPRYPAAAAAMNRIRPGTRWLRTKNAFYRTFFPRLHWLNRGKFFRCWGSGCSAWRWVPEEDGRRVRGYCGLAGRPLEVDDPEAFQWQKTSSPPKTTSTMKNQTNAIR